jgi:O-antigen/teichoic acid export membrane protein
MFRIVTTGVFLSSLLSLSASWLNKLVGLISSIILARLLTPADFGTVAIVILVIFFFELFAAVGSRAYLLTLPNVETADLNSSFTLGILFRVAITLMIVISAPWMADFFDNPALQIPLAVAACSQILTCLENPGLILLRRQLQYGLIVKITMIAKLSSFVVTIALAYTLRSYWALIIGTLWSSLISTLLSYHWHSYRPRLETSRISTQWHYSKWIFFNSFIGYARAKADTTLIAKHFSLADVGLFNIAKELGTLVYEQVALPLSDIVISGVKHAKDDVVLAAQTVENYLVMMLSVALPATLGIVVLADDLILLLLGEKWQPSAALLKPLAIFGCVYCVTTFMHASINARRKVKQVFFMDLIVTPLMVGFLYMQRDQSLITFALSVLAAGFLYVSCYICLVRYYLPLSLRRFVVGALPLSLASSTMFYSVAESLSWYQQHAVAWPLLLKVLAHMLLGVLVYVLVYFILLIMLRRHSAALRLVQAKCMQLVTPVLTRVGK